MNSSGLIYAVIVGAWAAYLVPMWLRRQDELNESRPTERFSTAIRLLSGKAAMERRYARESERRDGEAPERHGDLPLPDGTRAAERDDAPHARATVPDGADDPDVDDGNGADDADGADGAEESVDVRAFADPKTMVGGDAASVPTELLGAPAQASGTGGSAARSGGADDGARDGGAERSKAERDKARQKSKRAKVLARRRRTTMVLFLAFTAGTIVAAVGGLAFLWAPGVPGLLLSAYIVHLRVQERRRFAATMDKRRAKATADEPHAEQTGDDGAAPSEGTAGAGTGSYRVPAAQPPAAERAAAPKEEPAAVDRRALVEQTDHAEWVDQQRDGDRVPDGGWDPVPVPLPTYVSAPVAPRSTRGVDLEAPGTWSSARSSSVGGEPPSSARTGQENDEESAATDSGGGSGSGTGAASGTGSGSGARRGRGRRQTPLFDQYEDGDRPRAANE
ncbi:hypothetical protein HCC61_24300 [Streptomyces sp. HNM0575]|uniref:divisome protein SepX/GlpR n=1 Tax=Streptomyces sp. HNM0575 TaxID=2716338 RepID=UPI00145EFB67|nr:hypothetical protein [Streptomyces sp. HNM0575]